MCDYLWIILGFYSPLPRKNIYGTAVRDAYRDLKELIICSLDKEWLCHFVTRDRSGRDLCQTDKSGWSLKVAVISGVTRRQVTHRRRRSTHTNTQPANERTASQSGELTSSGGCQPRVKTVTARLESKNKKKQHALHGLHWRWIAVCCTVQFDAPSA